MASTATVPSAAHILAQFYEAETAWMTSPPEQRDFFATMGRFLSPSFRSIHSKELPWGGTWEGYDGFQKWMAQMAGRFSLLDVLEPQIFDSHEQLDSVMVSSTLLLITRHKSIEWRGPLAQRVKVNLERGWIEEIRVFWWDVDGLKKVLEEDNEGA